MKTHNKTRKKTKCQHCDKTFYALSNLISHCKTHHKGLSQGWLSDPKKIKWHKVTTKIDEDMPQCVVCKKNFARHENLLLHMQSFHTLNRPTVTCGSCKKTFNSQANLKKHISLFHSDKNSMDKRSTNRSTVDIIDETQASVNENDTIDDIVANDCTMEQTNQQLSASKQNVRKSAAGQNPNKFEHESESSKLLSMPIPAMCFDEVDFCLPSEYRLSQKNGQIDPQCWNFEMIRTNIYSKAAKPNKGFESQQCNCSPEDECTDNCLNRLLYTECDPKRCICGEKCQNMRIQNQIVAPVERFMTCDKGWGVTAKDSIEKGSFILEYIGNVINEREYHKRMSTTYKNDIHHYCLHLDHGLVIDAHRMGNMSRFINHACEPNCTVDKWLVNGYHRAGLFALRDIAAGEELTFDYNFKPFNDAQLCKCGSNNCRGAIVEKSKVDSPIGKSTDDDLFSLNDFIAGNAAHDAAHDNIAEPTDFMGFTVDALHLARQNTTELISIATKRGRKNVIKAARIVTRRGAVVKTPKNSIVDVNLTKIDKKTYIGRSSRMQKATQQKLNVSCSSYLPGELTHEANKIVETSSNMQINKDVVAQNVYENASDESKSKCEEERYEMTFSIDEYDKKRFLNIRENSSATFESVDKPITIETKEIHFPGNIQTILKPTDIMELYIQDINSVAKEMIELKEKKRMTSTLSQLQETTVIEQFNVEHQSPTA